MPAQAATALLATAETDAKLRAEYFAKGSEAFLANTPREQAPNGMIGTWWCEGYDKAAAKGT